MAARRSQSLATAWLTLLHAHALAFKVAIAPATGRTGLATLRLLQQLCARDEYRDIEVSAVCQDDEEMAACRMAVCGAVCREGALTDLCDLHYSCLRTTTRWQCEEVDTLVILSDDVHPVMDVSASGEQIITTPSASSPQTMRSHARSLALIDSAAAAGVGHLILHSSLGASGRALSRLNVARMGGQDHLRLRRALEERLKWSSRVHGTRHTILQAAPYATPL
eukprot:7386108-Prymnesium_polylepis.1